MITTLHIARNICRGSALQVLCCRSSVLRNSSVIKNLDTNNVYRCAPLFSTSQAALTGSSDHSHTHIWTAERVLAAGMLGLVPMALAFPNPALDYALALALTAHVHWGVEATVVDYLRPTVVGVTISRLGVATVYALSVFTLGGLFYFNYTDVGLCHAIRMLWKL